MLRKIINMREYCSQKNKYSMVWYQGQKVFSVPDVRMTASGEIRIRYGRGY